MSDAMTKVVMLYSTGDGCTYSCDNTHPILYVSPEQALVDFEKLCADAMVAGKADYSKYAFIFCGMVFNASDFYHAERLYPPAFLTVQEWFDQQGSQA